jgi:hypothetical protein
MQNLGADFVIKAFNAESTPAVSDGPEESASAAVDASSTPDVLVPTSDRPVAYTVPYPSSVESSSSSSSSSTAIESLPTPSSGSPPVSTSDSLPAPTSESPPAPISEVEPIPTSVLAVAESSPAAPSASSPDLSSASPTIVDTPESPSSQPAGGPRTRCQ